MEWSQKVSLGVLKMPWQIGLQTDGAKVVKQPLTYAISINPNFNV